MSTTDAARAAAAASDSGGGEGDAATAPATTASPRSTTASPSTGGAGSGGGSATVAASGTDTKNGSDAEDLDGGPSTASSSPSTGGAAAPSPSPFRDHNDAPLRKLSVHLLETYRHINQVYYAERQQRKKSWDDKHDNYIIKAGEKFYDDRFVFKKQVGKGSFGVVAAAADHGPNKCDVAIKIIKSQRPFAKQAQTEIRLLEFMRDKNKDEAHGIVRLLEYFRHRSHVCLVFEFLGMNLYELIKQSGFDGVSLARVAHFGSQLLDALAFLSREDVRIIHCDLKPENILICPGPEAESAGRIKIIDFGSSCFYTEKMYEYIQSRFYRSPEVILGIPYDEAIDMWSLGCIMFELHTGFPLFGGQNEEQQMQYICALNGPPPPPMLEAAKPAKRVKMFVDVDEPPVDVPVPGDKRSVDGKRSEGEISADVKSAAALEALALNKKAIGGGDGIGAVEGEGGGGTKDKSDGGDAAAASAASATGATGGDSAGSGGDGSAAAPAVAAEGGAAAAAAAAAVAAAAAPATGTGGAQATAAPTKRYRLKYSKAPTSLTDKLQLQAGGLRQWRLPSAARAEEVYAPFMDLVSKMLVYSPPDRVKPLRALEHPFIVNNVVTNTELLPFEDSTETDGASDRGSPHATTLSEDELDGCGGGAGAGSSGSLNL